MKTMARFFSFSGNYLFTMVMVWSVQAFGSGFAIQEQSGSGLGNAFAGGAAIAQDASTIFINPAGMTLLEGTQTSVDGSLVCPSAKFRDTGSQPAALQTLGDNGGDAGSCALVPSLYFSTPVSKKWWAGVAVNAPFGLTTQYDSEWLGRFQAVKSEIKTYNINPAVALKINERLSLGAGINWQRIAATLSSQANWAGGYALGVEQGVTGGLIPLQAVPTLLSAALGLESEATIKGNDNALGWNLGMLFTIDPQTRVGVQYRSALKYTVEGNANFSNPTLRTLPEGLEPVGAAIAAGVDAQLSDGPVMLNLELPASANLSVFHAFGNQWQVMADVQFTNWSSVQNLQIERADGSILTNTPEFFKDTWRFAVGASYDVSNALKIRSGLAYDISPVQYAQRTPRLPDEDRRWLSLGLRYQFSEHVSMDAAYSYILVTDAKIDQNEGNTAANGLISGFYNSHVNLAAVQLNYIF